MHSKIKWKYIKRKNEIILGEKSWGAPELRLESAFLKKESIQEKEWNLLITSLNKTAGARAELRLEIARFGRNTVRTPGSSKNSCVVKIAGRSRSIHMYYALLLHLYYTALPHGLVTAFFYTTWMHDTRLFFPSLFMLLFFFSRGLLQATSVSKSLTFASSPQKSSAAPGLSYEHTHTHTHTTTHTHTQPHTHTQD